MNAKRKLQGQGKGQLRIIGGQWRGRKLAVPEISGLRPTPDRVRETLFNWLAPSIVGARCLDAFAGTGALGLEALSRGAAEVTFVEQDRQQCASIEAHLHKLGGNGRVLCTQFSPASLAGKYFDFVFLDPPFDSDLLLPAISCLRGSLALGHRVYLEYAKGTAPQLGDDWEILKQKQAGHVGYCLARLATTTTGGEDKPL